jgi:hypothetical protein
LLPDAFDDSEFASARGTLADARFLLAVSTLIRRVPRSDEHCQPAGRGCEFRSGRDSDEDDRSSGLMVITIPGLVRWVVRPKRHCTGIPEKVISTVKRKTSVARAVESENRFASFENTSGRLFRSFFREELEFERTSVSSGIELQARHFEIKFKCRGDLVLNNRMPTDTGLEPVTTVSLRN